MLTNFKKNPLPVIISVIVGYLVLTQFFAFDHLVPSIVLIAVCIAQNTAFSIVSRARNRNNEGYHAIASVFSNGVWFLTMGYMITELDFEWWIIMPYVLGTVLGSLIGVRLSMLVERLIGATSDDHVKPQGFRTTERSDRIVSNSGAERYPRS